MAHHGINQWNGVAIASRVGLEDPIDGFADGIEPDPDARLVSARCGSIRVNSVYVPNGREVDHDHYHYKLSWLGRLRRAPDRHHLAGRRGRRRRRLEHRPDRHRRLGPGQPSRG